MARQCPRCELRFLSAVEVRDHLISDHGMTPEQLAQPYPLPSGGGTRSRGSRGSGGSGGEDQRVDDSPDDEPGGDDPTGMAR